jgi:hypothetical protein
LEFLSNRLLMMLTGLPPLRPKRSKTDMNEDMPSYVHSNPESARSKLSHLEERGGVDAGFLKNKLHKTLSNKGLVTDSGHDLKSNSRTGSNGALAVTET